MEVNGYHHLSGTVRDILQNIFFCVQLKKETHEGEERMARFSNLLKKYFFITKASW